MGIHTSVVITKPNPIVCRIGSCFASNNIMEHNTLANKPYIDEGKPYIDPGKPYIDRGNPILIQGKIKIKDAA